MDMTRDKLCSLVRKWHSLIEAFVDVTTLDGYTLRMFCIAFTRRRRRGCFRCCCCCWRRPDQVRSTCYAQTSQIRAIRKKMVTIMAAEASKCQLRDLVKKFIPESIGKDIENACKSIFPLQNVFIRKVKMLKKPKFDLTKLMEIHGETEDVGRKVQPESAEAGNTLTAETNKA
ncbi:UNVERIFIED_CONTAM: hypothetical protein H355_013376 [Colinus virginianus]|nr:hypothetical protein H355_013376 [Colinus virginianus]